MNLCHSEDAVIGCYFFVDNGYFLATGNTKSKTCETNLMTSSQQHQHSRR